MSAGACQRGLMWKRLFTDVIKLRVSRRAQSEDDLGGPETRRQVSSREKRGNAQRRPRETEAEVGVTQPHAEGCRGRQELEGQGGPSPRPSGGGGPAHPWISDAGLHTGSESISAGQGHPLWSSATATLGDDDSVPTGARPVARARQRGPPRGAGPGRAGPHPRAWRCW